jgi:hypothetical protein
LLNARCHCLNTHPGAQLLAVALGSFVAATTIENAAV